MPIKFELPARTILKILLTIVLAYAAVQLAPLGMTLFLSVLIAVTLDPLAIKLERRGLPRWAAISIITLLLVAILSFIVFIVLPPLADQISVLAQKLPELRDDIVKRLPDSGMLHDSASKLLQPNMKNQDPTVWVERVVSVGQLTMNALAQLFIILVFAIYMLVDGKSIFKWFLAFFSRENREKLQVTAAEVSEIMFSYVAGQLITSTLCGVFSFLVLWYLKVPAAVMLGMLAAVFDILPFLGFFLSLIPAVLLSLTVSGEAAIFVLIAYVLYNAVENYLIIPKVYGNRLRLTTLTVLVSILAASTLAGIGGAIAVLPIIASYPIIERIWLVNFLGEKVIAKHEIQKNSE